MRLIRTLFSLLIFVFILGCSSIRHHTMPDDVNLLSGAGAIAVAEDKGKNKSTNQYETIDVASLLQRYGLDTINDVDKKTADEGYKYRRNEVQDHLIAASNQRCDIYIRTLVASKAQAKMGWNGLATFLTGAATVVTPMSAARLLSAGATVSLGVLNAYDEAYLDKLTVQLISAGIKKQRLAALVNIQNFRNESLVIYPVNRAIADALSYHGMCNILTGLEAASTATDGLSVKDLAKKNETLSPLNGRNK